MARDPGWGEVREHCLQRIAQYQTELLGCPLDQVERVRGRIEAMRAVLALPASDAPDDDQLAGDGNW